MSSSRQVAYSQANTALLSSKPINSFGTELRDGQQSIDQALQRIFPGSKEESLIQRVRKIMGNDVAMLTDNVLGRYLTEYQSLIDMWIDSYEKGVFDGKSLQQYLKEG